jgi:hypothetical protein
VPAAGRRQWPRKGELGATLLKAGRRRDPDPAAGFHVRLRAEGQADLCVVVDESSARLVWAAEDAGAAEDPPAAEADPAVAEADPAVAEADPAVAEADPAAVEMDAGARQLFIWGRRPDHRGRLRSHLTQPQLARLQTLLSGY